MRISSVLSVLALAGTALAAAPKTTPNVSPQVAVNATSESRGRYTIPLPEGAHTVQASAPGYTTVFRQVVVPAGAGIVPIDIRLTKRGDPKTSDGTSPMLLTSGGETAVTKPVSAAIPGGAIPSGSKVMLTAVGAQSLAGLLPIGWSPLASAEVAVVDAGGASVPHAALGNTQLTFTLPNADITAANQTLSFVQYDEDRDEWRVLAAVMTAGADGKWTQPVTTSGAFAVVYADKAAGLAHPPAAQNGTTLQPVATTCSPCELVRQDFKLDPPIVTPTGKTVARLLIKGDGTATFPSGTAVQAYIDEVLHLSDGSTVVDPPFATDIVLYRDLSGTVGEGLFHLAPSANARNGVLSDGVDHIRILPYPGRLDRGTLIGPEGGRVPGDDLVSVEIPTGATTEPLHASVSSINQQDFPTIPGYTVLAGFTLSMSRANSTSTDPVELSRPARATLAIPAQNGQVLLVESLPATDFGQLYRLADPMSAIDSGSGTVRYTTRTIDPSQLPVDGVIHEGKYFVLAANAPVAWATGAVRLGAAGAYLPNARITANALGVTDLTRATGLFAIPVPATPATSVSLVARHATTGDSVPKDITPAPAPDTVVHLGDFVLSIQQPKLDHFSINQPDANAVDTSQPLIITATFSTPLDPTSKDGVATLTGGLTSTTQISGSDFIVTVTGKLQPGTRYTLTLGPTLRGSSGAPFGQVASFNFATRTIPQNVQVDANKVHITIPNDQGVSTVYGDPGAIPSGFTLVPTRRPIEFITRYQTQANAAGDFRFDIGTDPNDKVTVSDLIDLNVVNAAGNVMAIIPLTPFSTADGKGFIAPTNRDVKFTSAEGFTVMVTAGTFDQPTMVNVNKVGVEAFAAVPDFANEVDLAASVNIHFDGTAHKPLELETPVPAGFDPTGKYMILSWLGQSIRGPRLMAVDTVSIVGGKFTTLEQTAAAHSRQAPIINLGTKKAGSTAGVELFEDVKHYMLRATKSGVYSYNDIKVPTDGGFGWGFIDSVDKGIDYFMDKLSSYFAADLFEAEGKGRLVVPVITNKPFQIVGVDASTGLTAFQKAYNPIPLGDPGAAVILPSPVQNFAGPFLVFGTPFRVETFTVRPVDKEDDSLRNFKMKLGSSGILDITDGTDALPADLKVSAFNATSGFYKERSGSAIHIAAQPGDRMVLMVEQAEVDPATAVSAVFSEPINVGPSTNATDIDTYLHARIKVEYSEKPAPGVDPSYQDITAQVQFRVDSGARRVLFDMGSLQLGGYYRVTFHTSILDKGDPPMALGQVTSGTGATSSTTPGQELTLHFRVREPGGKLATFNIRQVDPTAGSGAIRDLSMNGNVLFVAAMNAGLLAYDISDPASMDNTAPGTDPVPFAQVLGDVSDYWSVASDRHGRIYTTALTPAQGVLRSYRMEKFLKDGKIPTTPADRQKIDTSVANAFVSWRPGYATVNLPLTTATILSDRVEGIPRKLQIMIQDDERSFNQRKDFAPGCVGVMGGGTCVGEPLVTAGDVAGAPPAWVRYTATFKYDAANPYKVQRVTVENTSLDMRWSADATPSHDAVITDIVARPYDQLKIFINKTTYGVIALVGNGISVFDLNAMESNDDPSPLTPAPPKLQEQILNDKGELWVIEDGKRVHPSCDQDAILPDLCAIPDFQFAPDGLLANVSNDTPSIYAYTLDGRHGMVDVRIDPPGVTPSVPGAVSTSNGFTRSPSSLSFVNRKNDGTPVYHARLSKIAAKFKGLAGREPNGRFSSVAYYNWILEAADNIPRPPKTPPPGSAAVPNPKGARGSMALKRVSRQYALVAGNELGLLVVELHGGEQPSTVSPWLEADNLVDDIWIPGGAVSVRTIPRTNLCMVTDSFGRILLVDLTNIDERWDSYGDETAMGDGFAKPLEALSTANTDPTLIGIDDTRIIWRSEPGMAYGTLPPIIDPDTGMVYAGLLLGQKMSVVAALDPRIQMKADVGATNGLSEVGGVVPLGIQPPAGVLQCDPAKPAAGTVCNASLAAFRLEVTLPGAIVTALGTNPFRVAVESERVLGAVTEQTPSGFPRAHLRQSNRAGSAETINTTPASFVMQRLLPEGAIQEQYRHQKAYNRFVTPWIVAIADPRAAKGYDWGTATAADKEAKGCASCERPASLKDLPEPQVFELYTNGRLIAVRPELTGPSTNIFSGTKYDYLGKKDRLVTRFATVMADTVRPPSVLTGQSAPVAGGLIQDTIYLHSGEVETSAVDLNAGGRAGQDVVFDRTYRSRTMGLGMMGQGWDSSIFRRLRALPNGDVEYRDGSGEVWRFVVQSGLYQSPKGLFLRLGRSDKGYTLTDAKQRTAVFDQLGRLTAEGDEFATSADPSSADGNFIVYLYDASGKLTDVMDPHGRISSLSYYEEGPIGPGIYPGLLKEITDWREGASQRTIDYRYTSKAALYEVELPDQGGGAGRPKLQYGYATSGTSMNDTLELSGNLETITEPVTMASIDPAPGNPWRVKFTYTQTGEKRDKVEQEEWGSGEKVTFDFGDAMHPKTVDGYGQSRSYELTAAATDYASDRQHLKTLTEEGVATYDAGFGMLPGSLAANVANTVPQTRTFTDGYFDDGTLQTATLQGIRSVTYGYNDVGTSNAPMKVIASETVSDLSGATSFTSITKTYNYQDGDAKAFLKSITADGKEIESKEPHRGLLNPQDKNNQITETATYDKHGLMTGTTGSGGSDAGGAGSSSTMTYWLPTDPIHTRGLPKEITSGGLLTTKIEYPSVTQTKVTDPRNYVTTTDCDNWGRATHINRPGSSTETEIDESNTYDALGRVLTSKRKQGSDTVTTTYKYDIVGRLTSTSTDKVNTPSGAMTSTTKYNVTGGHLTEIVFTAPGGSTTTSTLDAMGRVIKTGITTGGGVTINETMAYDLMGNLVYTSDDHDAMATAYDAAGRARKSRGLLGVRYEKDYNGWGLVTETRQYGSDGSLIGKTTIGVEAAGAVDSRARQTGASDRVTNFAWDGGGRTTGVAEGDRAAHSTFDEAGRLTESMSGKGATTDLTDTFTKATASGWDGTMWTSSQEQELKGGISYQVTRSHDALGNLTNHQVVGSPLQYQAAFDQAGNMTKSAQPQRGESSFSYDAQGVMKSETLPNGGNNTFTRDETGAANGYRDAKSEATTDTNDQLGRPLTRTYADSTSEVWTYDPTRLATYTDRQGRQRIFEYDPGTGLLLKIRKQGGQIIDEFGYDTAGRLSSWIVSDNTQQTSKIEMLDYDMDGHPHKVVQTRFKGGAILDAYTMDAMQYNEHGERTDFTMPHYTGQPTGAWSIAIHEDYDAMGNVVKITRDGSILMDATYQNAGRPITRTVTTKPVLLGTPPATIVRTYGYRTDGLLNHMDVQAGGIVVAGTHVEAFDGLLVKDTTLLGLSAGMTYQDHYAYDARGRLATAELATSGGGSQQTTEVVQPWDFRSSATRTQPFPTSPPSLSFTEAAGHKIATYTRGSVTKTVTFNGGERLSDGSYLYDFDFKGQLVMKTQLAQPTDSSVRRVRYEYNGMGRVVGRIAEYAPLSSAGGTPDLTAWKLEDRSDILASDALPAETTFVWDPITDRLMAAYKAGASQNPSIDAQGGLLRQMIHGGLGYDDPIEITTVDPSTTPGGVNRLYPIFDESAAGSLQAVMNTAGRIVSRNFNGGSYGEEQYEISGAAVDNVKLTAHKDSSGSLTSMDVTMRATEPLDPSSLPAGARLASVDASGKAVRNSTVTATVVSGSSLKWTLSAADWTTLTSTAPLTTGGSTLTPTALSIAATDTLRTATFGTTVLPPPDWAKSSKPVYSDRYPFEIRESLTSIAAFTGSNSTAPFTLYDVPSLQALGSPTQFGAGTNGQIDDPARLLLSAALHAAPFQEPLGGHIFFRARWLDPQTGTWLTPDPLLHRDSSNLYMAFAGDPVNGRDPEGMGGPMDAKMSLDAYYKEHPEALRDRQCNEARVNGSLYATGEVAVGFVTGTYFFLKGASGGNSPSENNAAVDAVQGLFHPIDRWHEMEAEFFARHAMGDCFGEGRAIHGKFFAPYTVAVAGTTDLIRGGLKKVPQVDGVPLPKTEAPSLPQADSPPARAAAPTSGFLRYVEAEKNINLTPATLAEIEDAIRLNGSQATTAAESASIPRTKGRLGTRAHAHFEALNKVLNEIVKKAGKGFEVRVEEFRDAAGNVTGRRAAGSVGLDAVVYHNGVPVAGFDLKTGRGWSPAELKVIQARFKAIPITEVKTKR